MTEAVLFSVSLTVDKRGTVALEKSVVASKDLYKYIYDDMVPELVEAVEQMQEYYIQMEHTLQAILNRRK